jgi:hypothetical protein
LPSCKLGNWEEVMNLSQRKAISLQNEITAVHETLSQNDGGIKAGLLALGLSEDDCKLSRGILPWLPRFQKPENRAILAGASSATGEGGNATDPEAKKTDDTIAGLLEGGKTSQEKASKGRVTESGWPKLSECSSAKFLTKPKSVDVHELTVHYSRYDWTSVPDPVPPGYASLLKPAAKVMGVSNNNWNRRSIVSKFETLAKRYDQSS